MNYSGTDTRGARPTPPEHRAGAIAWLRLYLTELGAYVLLYNLYQPFERLFVGAETLRPQHRAQSRNASETPAVLEIPSWQAPYGLWLRRTGRKVQDLTPAG